MWISLRSRLAFAIAGVLVTLAAVAGCATERPASGAKPAAAKITVAAASSLKPVLSDIIAGFERTTGNNAVAVYESSGVLAAQIENGAPFDVFLAADKDFAKGLEAGGYLRPARIYARGTIVLIGEAGSLNELASDSIKNVALANPKTAPYGAAGKKALDMAGLWMETKGKIVYSENIGQAFDFVATGNADAGIVALSQALQGQVDYIAIDKTLYRPIEQWGGIVKETKEAGAARAFMDFLGTPEAAKAFKKTGFIPAQE